jgi:hypothetical protein
MIKRVSTEIDSIINNGAKKMPAKEWTYWCNCGNIEMGGLLKGTPELEWCKKEWRRVNNVEE